MNTTRTEITADQAAQQTTCMIRLSANGANKFTVCKSMGEAAQAMREFIDENGLGASDLGKQCGEIRVNGVVKAMVSYNGRVWAA